MKLDLTVEHYQELIKKSYSLDAIFLLNLISEDYDVTPIVNSSVKIKALYTSLLRKRIITKEEKLTTLGIDILSFVSKKTNKKFIKKKPPKSDFDSWWEVFPSTDEFMMGTKRFAGTRGLRIAKEKCRFEWTKIIDEGEFSKEEIIRATLYDITQRKSNSLKQNKNNLTFLQGSSVYLNNRSFGPFISLSKKGNQKQFNQIIGSIDI